MVRPNFVEHLRSFLEMAKITLCIMIASGFERADTPAVEADRLEVLLSSIRNSKDNMDGVKIIVCDDFSYNKKGQQDCSDVCNRYRVDYIVKPEPWGGPCANYNYAVTLCETEYIAMLGDDQHCTPGWWDYMNYFIDHNPDLKWGMLGWSVLFADDLVRAGFFAHKRQFYTNQQLLSQINVNTIPRQAIVGNWCNWEEPRYRGACSGTAFIIKKSLWKKFSGFYEGLFQFDEDYGDNVWNITDHTCIQVPTPPILHYGGACAWNYEKGPSDERWRKGWEERPFVPVDFEHRGQKAADIINTRGNGELKGLNFRPLPFMMNQSNLVLDLGCGKNIRNKGAIGIDIVGKPETDASVVCNLGFEPLPFLDFSCKKVVAHDILEHIPHVVWSKENGRMTRLTPTIYLFNEVYRVLDDDGLFETAVPVYPNGECFQDPTHASVWTADSFNYFSGKYHNLKESYGHKSNFEVVEQFVDGAHLHTKLKAVKC
jgi:hypothetical protein